MSRQKYSNTDEFPKHWQQDVNVVNEQIMRNL